MMKHRISVSISLTPEKHQLLKTIAKSQNCTMGKLIEGFIVRYVAIHGTKEMLKELFSHPDEIKPKA